MSETNSAPEIPEPRARRVGTTGKVVRAVRPYEVMVIFDAGLDEEAIRALVDQTTKVITDGGGT
ncbi:MAG: 30S ribosomal protein S6, partial [Acidimicrobiaceae bacterium]|nr:30S ribosomal protein S6 [Acidimicrobiaceae bacterium]